MATLAVCLAALTLGAKQALGAALGGVIGLLLLSLHRGLGSRMLQPGRKLIGLVGCWGLWAAKWPLLGVTLYLALRSDMVSPGWLCVGATVVPAVCVALALRAVAVEVWKKVEAKG